MPKKISEELRQAYESTRFTAQIATSVDFKHGQVNPKADALLVLFDVQSAALITAWNPYSQPKSKEENETSQQRLEEELAAFGIKFLRAEGKGIIGDWPPEPSVLVLGLEFRAAQDLAVKYQQNAYLWIERGFPADLIYPDPVAIAEQASIIAVDSREQSTIASSWQEYLCVRWLGDRIELSVRMYESLATVSDFPENEDDEPVIPLQIQGKAVVGIDDDVVVGGDLGFNDEEPEVFHLTDIAGITEWLTSRHWKQDVVLEAVQGRVRESA